MNSTVELLPDRMLEQVETWTAWDRRCWEPGTILRLRELSEASGWVQGGVLSDASLTWLRSSIQPVIGQDQGLGQGAVRAQLSQLLKGKLAYKTQAQRQLDQLTEFAEAKYLDSWRDRIASGTDIDLEKASRFITGFVLDAGYHPEWLRRRTKELATSGAAATDLLDEYRAMINSPAKTHCGFVALLEVPEPDLLRQSESWLTPEEVARRLRSAEHGQHPRHVGGIRFEVEARDPRAAAVIVSEMMDRLVSRTQFLRSGKRLRYHDLWYTDDGHAYSLHDAGPQITVMSLVRTGVLYSASLTDEGSNAVDDALHLASNLMEGPPSVAAAGAWAALESLLVTGADNSREVGRSVAADRAAALVAASWPRAELTRLSYRVSGDKGCPSLLRAQLEGAGDENEERCRVLLDWLEAGKPVSLPVARDAAALDRMRDLTRHPRAVLNRVRGYMTSSLRRLYRQRNLVLHGGSVRPVALAATIRTSGPLVGAALDRVSHARELEGVDPLDAVARAECSLQAAGTADGWRLHQLALA